MSDKLPGFESDGLRAVHRVRVSMLDDKERIKAVLAKGGTFQEMRAAVEAWRVLDEGIRGLQLAVERMGEGSNE